MTTTESLVYDGGSSGGNSCSPRTQFVADSTTGQRQTVYHYDYRGRLVLSVGPQAPFSVVKYDHRGRTIASGAYSVSSGLSASTDPTSTTSNRIALHQTFYDERGQVWKSQRTRSRRTPAPDADTLLSLNWYDPDGRLIKSDAEQLTKTATTASGALSSPSPSPTTTTPPIPTCMTRPTSSPASSATRFSKSARSAITANSTTSSSRPPSRNLQHPPVQGLGRR
ncbi:MAG: hypothetical protein IPM33_10640 [Phycisphaerales bacterium]|nr:hypothetical protein [Phycisphaerales bacterium]